MARVSKNPRIRLGRGQLTPADVAVWEARRMFLRAVSRVSPDTYLSLFPGGPGEAAFVAWRDRWNDDLPAMIAGWQEHWNLPDTWCADVAVSTLRAQLKWRTGGLTAQWGIDRRPDGFVTPRACSGASEGALAIPAHEMYWSPETESREDGRARLYALVDAELDRIETASAHPATRRKMPDHFFWLARYQVSGESKELIADTSGHDRTQVGRAVNDLADLIGLTLRAPNRGRPRRRTANTVRFPR